jgi:hypothetical protein
MRITRSHCQKLKAATANQNKRQSLNRKDAIAKKKSGNRQIEKPQSPNRKAATAKKKKGAIINQQRHL